MKFPGSLATAGLAILVASAAFAAPAPILSVHTPSPTPEIGAAAPGVAFGRASFPVRLPDSTVARLYFGKSATLDVTLRDFVQARTQLELPPGPLTPDVRAQVLDLLLQKKLLSHQAAKLGRAWTREDSVNYRGLVDRLTLRAALDSALAEQGYAIATRGDSVPDRTVLGIMVRDSAMARLQPAYDEALIGRLAAAFAALPKPVPSMSIPEQIEARLRLPEISAEDSAKTLVNAGKWSYTAGQLLRDFEKLNRAYRPAIHNAGDIRDAVNNIVYENMLRENVVKQDLEHRPSIAALLAQRAEYLDAQSYVRRAAYDKVAIDSATVRRHFEKHPRWFDTWASAEICRGVFPTRASADSFAKVLAVPGMADSLVKERMESGIAYGTYLTEDADTLLFSRLRRARVGGIVGPDETVDGWRVFRVMKIVPRRPRSFEEARDIVIGDWYQRDGDRRVRELMREMAAGSLVQVNESAMAKFGPPAPAGKGRAVPGRKPAAGATGRSSR